MVLHGSVEILELIYPPEVLKEVAIRNNSDNTSDWQTSKKYRSIVKIRLSALMSQRSKGPLQVMCASITLSSVKQAQRHLGYSSCLTRQYNNAMGCRQSKAGTVRLVGIFTCLENKHLQSSCLLLEVQNNSLHYPSPSQKVISSLTNLLFLNV